MRRCMTRRSGTRANRERHDYERVVPQGLNRGKEAKQNTDRKGVKWRCWDGGGDWFREGTARGYRMLPASTCALVAPSSSPDGSSSPPSLPPCTSVHTERKREKHVCSCLLCSLTHTHSKTHVHTRPARCSRTRAQTHERKEEKAIRKQEQQHTKKKKKKNSQYVEVKAID